VLEHVLAVFPLHTPLSVVDVDQTGSDGLFVLCIVIVMVRSAKLLFSQMSESSASWPIMTNQLSVVTDAICALVVIVTGSDGQSYVAGAMTWLGNPLLISKPVLLDAPFCQVATEESVSAEF
jgi:hypothetical protein